MSRYPFKPRVPECKANLARLTIGYDAACNENAQDKSWTPCNEPISIQTKCKGVQGEPCTTHNRLRRRL
jgi:hypothetical protein